MYTITGEWGMLYVHRMKIRSATVASLGILSILILAVLLKRPNET